MRIAAGAEVIPVQHVLAEFRLPAGSRGSEACVPEVLRRGVRVGVEGCPAVSHITGPPADRDLLRIHRVAHDEVLRRRIGWQTGEEAHRQIERTPPGVDGSRASTIRRTELSKHECGTGRGGEVGSDLAGIVGFVFVVLVEWHAPRYLLGRWVDLDGSSETTDRCEHLTRDLAYRSIRGQRYALHPPIAVLGD